MAKKTVKNAPSSNLNKTTTTFLFIGTLLIVLSFVLGSIRKNPPQDLTSEIGNEIVEKDLDNTEEPEVIQELPVGIKFTAKSYLLYDVNSSKIVGGKDIDKQVANASTTKLMTALVALDTYPLNRILTVPPECIGIEGNNVGFQAGEKFHFEDILYGILLRSASDAVCVVTANYPGDFIEQMNFKAKELNLNNTNYVNAIGLDIQDHYSSSRDLLNLTLEIKKRENLKIIMGSRYFTLYEAVTKKPYNIENTNRLLFEVPGAVGYKTGFTSNAGECLVFGYTNFGTELIIVVMGSEDRFYDAKHLLDLYLLKLGNPSPQIIATPTPASTPTTTPTPSFKPVPVQPNLPD